MYNHSDFGKSFKIVITEEPDKEIKDKFFNDLSSIDKQLIEYYKSINSPDEKYFNLYSEDNLIGYSRLIFQLEYVCLNQNQDIKMRDKAQISNSCSILEVKIR